MQNKLLFYCTKKGDKNQIVKSTCYSKPFPFLINLCFLIFLLFFCFCFYYNVIGPTTSKSSIQCIKCFYAQNQLFINAKSSRPAKCVYYLYQRLGRRICGNLIKNPILCAHLNGPVQANVSLLVLQKDLYPHKVSVANK